jgi:hypothetical protein
MRNVVKIVAIFAFLGSRGALAQTVEPARSSVGSSPTGPFSLAQNTRPVDAAPVGHRQPHAREVTTPSPNELERLTAEDSAVDRKLVICHGC